MHQKIATVTLDSPSCSCITSNATLAQMKTHSITVYRRECDQLAAWTGGGLHHRTTRALNEGKHPGVLLPHPQPAHLMLGCCRPRNCSSECEIQQMALQFWSGRYGGSNQLFMKNGYDHHEHHDIYTYNLSIPMRFTLNIPAKSPPLIIVWLMNIPWIG